MAELERQRKKQPRMIERVEVPGVSETQVSLKIDTASLPPVTYTNHLVTQFTGTEVVLYATLVEHPLQPEKSGEPPKELGAKVQARLVMPPDRYLDHIIRSIRWIESNPILREVYGQMLREPEPEGEEE